MISRKSLICAAPARPAIITRRGFIAGATAAAFAQRYALAAKNGGRPWPGRSQNPVGFFAAPGYSGNSSGSGLSANAATSVQANGTQNFQDFTNLGLEIGNVSNLTFNGCRFQAKGSSAIAARIGNVGAGGGITFNYCSFTPSTADYLFPPLSDWPSATSGLQYPPNQSTCGGGGGYNFGPYGVDPTKVYQIGLDIPNTNGPVTLNHCDFWGFGNCITIETTSGQLITIDNCWLHDAGNPDNAATCYHTDGVGYLNGGTPPSNVQITNNTIATMGSTSGIALQTSTSPYTNFTVTGNFFGGFGNLIDMGILGAGTATNMIFTDNVFGTDVPWSKTPGTNSNAMFTGNGNLWRRNTIRVRGGTANISVIGSLNTPTYNDSVNGQFVLPNNTLSTTDFTG